MVATILLASLVGCQSEENNATIPSDDASPATKVSTLNYTVKKTFVHDTSLYTEGFLIRDGKLYESTGSPDYLPHTRSMIGISNLQTGKYEKLVELDRNLYFGEGIVFIKDKLYQLTYTTQTGFIYDAKTFKQIGKFHFSNREGWSLTTDGRHLIMSDGTNTLTYMDADSLKPVRTIQVTQNGIAVDDLNELEYIQGYIFANVFMTDRIVKIDPDNGHVVGTLDLSSLVHEARSKYRDAEVLNGIAYDSLSNQIYITGKQWPTIYQIELIP